MRTFIAVKMSESIVRGIEPIRNELAELKSDVKWVEPENMHLTLKFLGEIDPAKVPQVTEAIREATAGVPPFDVRVEGLGTFPAGRDPRVVWLGLEDPAGALARIAGLLDRLLVPLGVPAEGRPFRSHLTLGRVKGPRGINRLVRALAAMPRVVLGTQTVDEVILFESQLTSKGPIYTRVATQKLAT